MEDKQKCYSLAREKKKEKEKKRVQRKCEVREKEEEKKLHDVYPSCCLQYLCSMMQTTDACSIGLHIQNTRTCSSPYL